MSSATEPVPPVPQHTPPVEERSGLQRFTNNWMQWFLLLRDKINVINESLVTLGIVTDPGILAKQADGSWAVRTITGTSDRISVSNGDGSANPVIDVVDEGIEDIIAGFLVAGANITLTHNDAAGTLTISASGGGGSGGYPAHDEYKSTTPISTTATFPADTTIPQITEGADTGASVTLDVVDGASTIRVSVAISYASSSVNAHGGFYIFRDGAADTVGGAFNYLQAGLAHQICFYILVPAGAAGLTTFTLRYGGQTNIPGTTSLLQISGTNYHGAAGSIVMTALELPP